MANLWWRVAIVAGAVFALRSALLATQADPHSTRYGVVLLLGGLAALCAAFATHPSFTGADLRQQSASSYSYRSGQWFPTPVRAWRFGALVLGLIAAVCFFALGNDS